MREGNREHTPHQPSSAKLPLQRHENVLEDQKRDRQQQVFLIALAAIG